MVPAPVSAIDCVSDRVHLCIRAEIIFNICAAALKPVIVVLVVMLDRTKTDSKPVAINACLRPICSIDGMEITTTEGLGNARDGYSREQDSIAAGNGSQCGFCTPGMLTSLAAFLDENPDPSERDIREAISGNICRCTGYQGIVDAALDAAKTMREG